MRITERRAAGLGITVLFLALARTLGEIYRLRVVRGPAFGLTDALPYVSGGLMAAAGAWVAFVCYAFERHRLAVGVAALTVLAMLTYKLAFVR